MLWMKDYGKWFEDCDSNRTIEKLKNQQNKSPKKNGFGTFIDRKKRIYTKMVFQLDRKRTNKTHWKGTRNTNRIISQCLSTIIASVLIQGWRCCSAQMQNDDWLLNCNWRFKCHSFHMSFVPMVFSFKLRFFYTNFILYAIKVRNC